VCQCVREFPGNMGEGIEQPTDCLNAKSKRSTWCKKELNSTAS